MAASEITPKRGNSLAMSVDHDGGIVLRANRKRYELSELVPESQSRTVMPKLTGESLKARNLREGWVHSRIRRKCRLESAFRGKSGAMSERRDRRRSGQISAAAWVLSHFHANHPKPLYDSKIQ